MSEKRRLFMYAVILHTKEIKDGKPVYTGAELLIEPKYVLAANEKEVVFKATRAIPEEKASNPDDIDIVVKSF